MKVPRSLLFAAAAAVATGLIGFGFVHAQTENTNTVTTATVATAADPSPPAGVPHGGHLDELATLFGIGTTDLQTQLQSGTPLYQIAVDHGFNYTKLQAKQQADYQARLNDMVAKGFLTQDQANQFLQNYTSNLANGTGMGMGMLGPLGIGHRF